MKRLAASLCAELLAILALLALILAACGPETPAPAISLQSPIETPTATATPTVRPGPTRTPPRATPTPPRATPTLTPGTPTALPTVSGPLPPGPKLVYARLIDDGVVSFWAASVVNPSLRKMLATADPARFGANATLSHDGSQIAYVFSQSTKSWNAELWTVRIDGTERRQLASSIDQGRYVNYPLWSPDDRYLAFVRSQHETAPQMDPFPYTQTISVIDIATNEETPLVQSTIPRIEEELIRHIFPLDWSVNGRYLYYKRGAAGHVELWRVNVSTLESEYVALISEQGVPRCYFFSPDGRWLLCTVLESSDPRQYAVVRVSTESGQVETIIDGASEEQYNPIWHPSGEEVTFNLPPQANQQAQLRTIDLRSRRERTIAATEEGSFAPFAWSPDGQWIATEKYPNRSVLLISQDGTHIAPMEDVGPLIGWLGDELPNQQH